MVSDGYYYSRFIPTTFYDMSLLSAGIRQPKFNQIFGTKIYFDWYGRTESLYQIQIQMKSSMLNIN